MEDIDENIKQTIPDDQEEKQQYLINEANASLVFTPAHIQYFPHVKTHYGLTHIETLLYGFIHYYLFAGKGKFYFTNEQLSAVLDCSVDTIKNAIKVLSEKHLVEFSYQIKAGGGTVRFATRLVKNPPSDGGKFTSPTVENLPANKNKINKNNKDTNVSLLGDTSPKEKKNKSYKEVLNPKIEEILTLFERYTGHIPADRNPRQVAQNVKQLIDSFVKRNQETYQQTKQQELTFAYTLGKSWEWYAKKKYCEDTEKLLTFKLKMKVFLDDIEKRLLQERRFYEETRGTITGQAPFSESKAGTNQRSEIISSLPNTLSG